MRKLTSDCLVLTFFINGRVFIIHDSRILLIKDSDLTDR